MQLTATINRLSAQKTLVSGRKGRDGWFKYKAEVRRIRTDYFRFSSYLLEPQSKRLQDPISVLKLAAKRALNFLVSGLFPQCVTNSSIAFRLAKNLKSPLKNLSNSLIEVKKNGLFG